MNNKTFFSSNQGIHNRLQNEKSRLATAIQACEAATASISRPTSPLDNTDDPGHRRELEAKLKLEDLIDQVRMCFVDYAQGSV